MPKQDDVRIMVTTDDKAAFPYALAVGHRMLELPFTDETAALEFARSVADAMNAPLRDYNGQVIPRGTTGVPFSAGVSGRMQAQTPNEANTPKEGWCVHRGSRRCGLTCHNPECPNRSDPAYPRACEQPLYPHPHDHGCSPACVAAVRDLRLNCPKTHAQPRSSADRAYALQMQLAVFRQCLLDMATEADKLTATLMRYHDAMEGTHDATRSDRRPAQEDAPNVPPLHSS